MKSTGFTLENTARANYFRPTVGGFSFYDLDYGLSGSFTSNGTVWRKISSPAQPNELIKLSRPQSDIEALFDGAPEWATGYAKLEPEHTHYYWVDDQKFQSISSPGSNMIYFGQCGTAEKLDFTIIATRPESKPTPENTSVKPVYTQEMYDNEDNPTVGMQCLILYPTNNYKGTITYMGRGVGAFYSDDNNTEFTFSLDAISFKPVDTRTDKEKACDAIWKELDDKGTPHDLRVAMELAYDKWVGK